MATRFVTQRAQSGDLCRSVVLNGYTSIEISRVIVRDRVRPVPTSPSFPERRRKKLVEITIRVGFIIPANDLTKRARGPKTFRIESSRTPGSLPGSRPVISSLSLSLSLSLSAGEKLFSHLYSMMQSMLASCCGSSDRIPRKLLGKSLGGAAVSQPSRGGWAPRPDHRRNRRAWLMDRQDRQRKFTYECLIPGVTRPPGENRGGAGSNIVRD